MIRRYPLTLISNQTLVKEKPAFSQASRDRFVLENSGFPVPHRRHLSGSSFHRFPAPQSTGENRLAPPLNTINTCPSDRWGTTTPYPVKGPVHIRLDITSVEDYRSEKRSWTRLHSHYYCFSNASIRG